MNKTVKIVLIVVFALFLMFAVLAYFGFQYIGGFLEKGPGGIVEIFEKYEEEIPFDGIEEIREAIEKERVREVIDEVDVEEEDPYETARTIMPMEPRSEVMHEHFRGVLKEVFEKEPKLVGSDDITVLIYIVNRVIAPEDVSQIRNLLEQKDYELVGTTIENWRYELRFSAKILDREYRGNIYLLLSTSEEMEEHTQKIEVRIL